MREKLGGVGSGFASVGGLGRGWLFVKAGVGEKEDE